MSKLFNKIALSGSSVASASASTFKMPVLKAPAAGTTKTPPGIDTAAGKLGLQAEYFSLKSGITSISEVNFGMAPVAKSLVGSLNWGTTFNPFWKGGPTDLFAAKFSGDLNVTKAGSYKIFLTSDDGSALYLNGKKVIDNDGLHGAVEKSVTLNLTKGSHDIEIRYFENKGSQTLKLEWQGPESLGARSLITNKNLSHEAPASTGGTGGSSSGSGTTSGGTTSGGTTGGGTTGTTKIWPGLKAEYFPLTAAVSNLGQVNFAGPAAMTGTIQSLAWMWADGGFWKEGKDDLFAARFSGDLNVVNAGKYTIFLTSDDGAQLYVDGKLVVNNDGAHSTQERKVVLNLTKGSHDIEIRYFENWGDQSLKLEWRGPDSGGARKIISGPSLSHDGPINAGVPGPCPGDGGTVCMCSADNGGGTSSGTDGGTATPPPVDHDHGTTDGSTGGTTGGSTSSGGTGGTTGGSTGGSTGGTPTGSTTGGSTSSGGTGTGTGTTDGHDHGTGGTTTGGTTGGTTGSTTGGTTGGSTTGGTTGGGTSSGGTTDSHDHAASPTAIPTPPAGATVAQINAYVAAVKAQAEPVVTHDHGNTAKLAGEHSDLVKLVPRAEATHVAVADGDWFAASTWANGQIPGEGAKVLIPDGVDVRYNGESTASIFSIRVDGELSFATDRDTSLIVDTLVVTSTGRLEIGTEDQPVNAGVTTEILIADNGPINTAWDAKLLSRGIISEGEVEIHGAEKTSFVKVDAAPMKGATVIDLGEVPIGWRVGDTIVITGTHKEGWYAGIYHESQDEEVVITAINGDKITIDRPLVYDHDTPRSDLAAYVANTTRNITIASEGGEETPVHERGHVMLMHSDNIDVRYAAFDDLGRTDKSEDAFDVGSLGSVDAESNIKGRYSLHIHRTGSENMDDPTIVMGNSVSGSPGWGFVQHSANADFIDNVAFDVFGAAFAAEDGDETGMWLGNIAIRAEGIGYGDWSVKEGDPARHDNGRTGDGFFFAGRLVEAAENVAVNTTHGFVWFHRSAPANPDANTLDHPEAAYGSDTVPVDQAVIQGFRDNEAFGTSVGLIVIKGNAAQDNDLRSVLDGFLNWETVEGTNLSYTAHYTLKDFDLIGTTSTDGSNQPGTGFVFGTNAFDIVLNGLKLENFSTGVDLSQDFTYTVANKDVGHVLIDVTMSDVGIQYDGLNVSRHQILAGGQLVEGRLGFNMTGDTTISDGEAIYLNGTKTDSIGSRDRQFAGDVQILQFNENIAKMLAEEGYYTTSDGRKVLLVEDFVADRATGELYKFAHVFTLDMTDGQLQNGWALSQLGGAKNNGAITLGGQAPITANDRVGVNEGTDLYLNVLSNDRDPEGRTLQVDGFTDATHGDVYQQDDGRLMYRPDEGFSGVDTFSYWATDGSGNFTKATVTVDVWDL